MRSLVLSTIFVVLAQYAASCSNENPSDGTAGAPMEAEAAQVSHDNHIPDRFASSTEVLEDGNVVFLPGFETTGQDTETPDARPVKHAYPENEV